MLLSSFLNKKNLAIGFIVMVLVGVGFFTDHQNLIRDTAVSAMPDDILHQVGEVQTGEIIYIAKLQNQENHGGGNGMEGSDLVIFDPKTNKKSIIAKNIWSANFSKVNNLVVTADTDNKIRLYSTNGEKKAEIGNNGSNPIFAHDDKYVAYQKLADKGEDYFMLSENAKGLALYDVSSGEEKMITTNRGDDWPIGFSADKKFFYFNASRPYENSILGIINIEAGLYSLEMSTGKVNRLTNTDERKTLDEGPTISFINNKDAIWTSDRLTVITDVGSLGIYQYNFNLTGGLDQVVRVSDGDSLQWVNQDKVYKVRTLINGKESWNIVTLK